MSAYSKTITESTESPVCILILTVTLLASMQLNKWSSKTAKYQLI